MALVALGTNGPVDPTSEEFMEKGQSGAVTGVIIPPPAIRAVVDKTATFVARHGKSFEQKIVEKDPTSSKFNFMRPHDPYNAYYEFKIKECEENGGVAPPKAPPKPPPKPAAVEEKDEKAEGATGDTSTGSGASSGIVRKQKMSAIAKALVNKPTTKPPPHQFILVHPLGLSAVDMDVIKLTAQYTAVSGRTFLAGLAQREQRNPQFDFLKPTHMLFTYFTSLVDAYSKVLAPQQQQRAAVEAGLNTTAVLEGGVHRWQWQRAEEDRKAREQADSDKMQQLYMSVDWHDFVLVETIEFPESELSELLPTAGESGDGSEGAAAAAPPPPPVPTPAPAAATADDEDMDMDMDDEAAGSAPLPSHVPKGAAFEDEEEDDGPAITVVRDYRPDVSSAAEMQDGAGMVMVDPITKRQVPANEMEEHMRIQLLDPKWREEQQRLKEKHSQETLAEGGNIAAALTSFARQRGDIFGSAEEEAEELHRERAKAVGKANAQAAAQAQAAAGGATGADGGRLVWGSQAAMQQQQPPPPPPSIPARRPTAPFGATGGGGGGMPPPPPPPSLPPPRREPAIALTPQTNTLQAPPAPPPAPSPALPTKSPAAAAAAAGGGGGMQEAQTAPPPRPGMMLPPPGLMMGGAPLPPPGLLPPPSLPPLPPPPLPPPAGAPAAAGMSRPAPVEAADDDVANGSAAKKARVNAETGLMSEADYAASLEGEALVVKVQLPSDASAPGEWQLQGQSLEIALEDPKLLVAGFKQLLSDLHCGGMPLGKFQIKSATQGFLKDRLSLAHYNVKSGEVLEVSRKKR